MANRLFPPYDRDIPGARKIGAFSGRPLPSVLSFEYSTYVTMIKVWAEAKLRIAQGVADEADDRIVRAGENAFADLKIDPRDYGFEDIPTLDLKLVPAGTPWGHA